MKFCNLLFFISLFIMNIYLIKENPQMFSTALYGYTGIYLTQPPLMTSYCFPHFFVLMESNAEINILIIPCVFAQMSPHLFSEPRLLKKGVHGGKVGLLQRGHPCLCRYF